MNGREVRLARRPVGSPAPGDFAVVPVVVPAPGEGEVLVVNRYMALGAVMRSLVDGGAPPAPRYEVGRVMFAKTLGEVVVSRTADLPVGTTVLHMAGWRDYTVGPAAQFRPVPAGDPLVHLGGGRTAMAGLRAVEVRPGDTVYVSGAAGGVGSAVVPIARALGANTVIGGTGSAWKVAELTDRIGYDGAFDHGTERVGDALRRLAPQGVDVMFDTVGGSLLADAVEALNPRARIALCGALSQQLGAESGLRLDLMTVIGKRLSLHAFTAADLPALEAEYLELVRHHDLRFAHTVVAGLSAAPQALLDLFAGRHTGAVVVQLDHPA